MRKGALLILLPFFASGCLMGDRTTARERLFGYLLAEKNQQQQIPPIPLREWVTVEDLALDGIVSARMTISDQGDLYYAYAQTLLSADAPKAGLPAFHLRTRMKDAKEPLELPSPAIDAAVTTAAVLGLKVDSAGNLYLLTTTYIFSTDSLSFALHRYAAGTTTPSLMTLPTSFRGSTKAGSGFHVDRTSGTLFIGGSHVTTTPSGTDSVASVAVSMDAGATWTLKDASSTNGTAGFGFTTGADGAWYLAGAKPVGAGSATSWVLYRSTDQGATFSEIDSALPSSAASGASARAEYVGVSASGRLVAVGTDVIDPISMGTALVVRESSDGGTTWKETTRFSARAYPTGTDTQLGLMQARGITLGPQGFAAVPVLESKRPSSYLLVRSPALGGAWTTALSITSLNDGESTMQGVEFDPATQQLYLLTSFLKYTERQSHLRLTRF